MPSGRCFTLASVLGRWSAGGRLRCSATFPTGKRAFSSSEAVSASSRSSQTATAFIFGSLAGSAAVGLGMYVSQHGTGGTPTPSDSAYPYKRTLYVMRGVPASGKSTVAQGILRKHLMANGITGRLDNIASMNRTFILATDDFFSPIDEETGTENTVFDMSQIKRHHERNQTRCEIAMELGISPIIVDNTHTCAWEMRAYVELARANGYDVLIKDVVESQQLTIDIIKERLLARQAATGKEVPFAAVERMLKRYEKLPSDPDAAIAHILQAEPPWAKKKASEVAA